VTSGNEFTLTGLSVAPPSADTAEVSRKRLGLGLGVLGVALELPMLGQLFVFGDVFSWSLLLFLTLLLGPLVALAGLGISASRRDFWGVAVSGVGFSALPGAVPLVGLAILWGLGHGGMG
jgi:hypothetical protein